MEGPKATSVLLQTRAAEGRTISVKREWVFDWSRLFTASSVHHKERRLLLRDELSRISCHTLTVKMYFRETCKFFCTVLITCSILSCRNHCDMSGIK